MKWLITFLLTLAAPALAGAADIIDIPGGVFVMGDTAGDANEAPKRVAVKPFGLMRTEVTNRSFAAFVKRMASAVLLEPVPAITGTRPSAASIQSLITRSCSG